MHLRSFFALVLLPCLAGRSAFAETGTSSTAAELARAAETSSASAVLGAEELEADLDQVEVAAEEGEQGKDDSGAFVLEEVQVVAQRIAEPARPDTTSRLTGRQLEERGITNLAQALELLPDTNVRAAGRGGFQVDIRGARKGGVMILLDGIPISDVYNGNFDLTSIATTDIAEIRVALTPASPLDGPGGNGGVIEVLTRSATGPERARAELQGSSAPGGSVSVSLRSQLYDQLYLRASGGGSLSARDLPVTLPDHSRASIDESARSSHAGLRLERRFGPTRASVDVAAARRSFIIPPQDSEVDTIQRVDREHLFRAVGGVASLYGAFSFSAQAYTLLLDRDAVRFRDATLATRLGDETLFAHRTGGRAQADWALGDQLRLTLVTHLQIEGAKSSLTNPQGRLESHGTASVIQPAAGATWAITPHLGLDATAGVAIPLGIDASPWPEAKVWLTLTSTGAVEVRLTGARKGRVPTLRDRFEIGLGNPALDPELGTSGELDIVLKALRFVSITACGYFRLTNGLIRRAASTGALDNVGDVTVAGFESRAESRPIAPLTLGASYAFAHASSKVSRDPLDFFPAHRAQAWASLRPIDAGGLFATLRYTGARFDSGDRLTPYATVDASIFGRLNSVEVSLRVENLLDQGFEARSGVPGFGRTLYLGVKGEL